MRLKEVIEILEAELITNESDCNLELISACGSDLMSDVMAFSKESALLLTGLVNPQVIRTAEMMDIKAVVFVRGKKPQTNMIELATEKNIALLSTRYPMFASCGKLFVRGLEGRGGCSA